MGIFDLPSNGDRCRRLPALVSVHTNNVPAGSTDHAIVYPSSFGLANAAQDDCGSGKNAHTTNFVRADGGTPDNSIRHLFSYHDTTSSSQDMSRCTSCCWGCAGVYEVVQWHARPRN